MLNSPYCNVLINLQIIHEDQHGKGLVMHFVLFGANDWVFELLGTVEPLNKDTFGTVLQRCCPLSQVIFYRAYTYESSFRLPFVGS